ncbi:MAG: Got1/Sft2-like family vesicle transport protein [Christensenellales bacterium]
MENEIHERKTYIQTKNITLKQTPETDEALKLLNEKKSYLLKKIIALGICFAIGILFFFCSLFQFVTSPVISNAFVTFINILSIFSMLSAIVFGVLFFVYLNKRSALLRPYYELLRVAQRNDEIRHEERIRWRERKRLEYEEQSLPDLKLKTYSDKKLSKIEEVEFENLSKIENGEQKQQKVTVVKLPSKVTTNKKEAQD